MLINKWDVGSANARQHRVTYGNSSISSNSEWVRGSPFPVFFRNEIGFKQIEVQLILRETKEEAMTDISTILSHLLEPAELTLDNNDHRFYGILKKQTVRETVQERWYDLLLTFDCYEYSREIAREFQGLRTFSVRNSGNILTPVAVEIAPRAAVGSITLTGLCRGPDGTALPITVRNLTSGRTVVIDGESGLVTEAGSNKAKDVDFWAPTTLLPGANTVTVNSDQMDITLRYRPRFM